MDSSTLLLQNRQFQQNSFVQKNLDLIGYFCKLCKVQKAGLVQIRKNVTLLEFKNRSTRLIKNVVSSQFIVWVKKMWTIHIKVIRK